jgi:hypothetical protein
MREISRQRSVVTRVVGAAALALLLTSARPVEAQVAPPAYGEGPGATGVQGGRDRSDEAPRLVNATRLPRTGEPWEDVTWTAPAAAGGAVFVIGLALLSLRRRRLPRDPSE